MVCNMTVAAALVKDRKFTTGERKGEVMWSVTFACNGDDFLQTHFVVSCGSEAEAQALAAKYPHGSKVRISYIPRESVYIDQGNIQLAK